MSYSTDEIFEINILHCLFMNPELINELYIDEKCFISERNRKTLRFFKIIYKEYKSLDIGIMVSKFKEPEKKNEFMTYLSEIIDGPFAMQSEFYKYQEELQERYRNSNIDNIIKQYDTNLIDRETLISRISDINNENLYLKAKNNKKTPEEMMELIRGVSRKIKFDRFENFNSKLVIKQNTVNIIGARPSEGKSALALNLFCDLSKNYKCLYFNMEMTEAEVYERMLGIESQIPIEDIRKPQSDYQDTKIKEVANKIFNYKYEVVNGSKSISSLRTKIIKEQREEHLIVFIDYVGYVTSKAGLSDKDRIGEVTRELNNLTKDYNCTIFIIAQINRGGTDMPTMNDLKDSGELEQSADTIILINDPNKNNNDDTKIIELVIPKCRGAKRNVKLNIKYLKNMQRMEDYNEYQPKYS